MSLRQKDKDSEDKSEDNDGGVDYENLRPTYTHEALKVLLDKVIKNRVLLIYVDLNHVSRDMLSTRGL